MPARIKVTGGRARTIRSTTVKARTIDPLDTARALGAEIIGSAVNAGKHIPHIAGLRQRLFTALKSSGGRPRIEGTARRQKIPMSDTDWRSLEVIAASLSSGGPAPAPGQVASQLLHDAIQAYQKGAPVPLHFPVTELVPETKRHLCQKITLWQILELAFREHSAIGCDQFVYWDPTDPKQCLAPDAFVRLGVPDEQFECWKVWERGAPQVAVEILSESDARDRDLNANLEKYRRLGVRELVCFDSEQDPPSLRVWEAVDGDLVERAVDGHVAPSRCLPATWVVVPDKESGALLRLSRDAEGKDLLPTPVEHERRAGEERIRELEAELRRRGAP